MVLKWERAQGPFQMWGLLSAQFQDKGRWRARESLGNVGEGLRLVPIKGQGPGSQSPSGGGEEG